MEPTDNNINNTINTPFSASPQRKTKHRISKTVTFHDLDSSHKNEKPIVIRFLDEKTNENENVPLRKHVKHLNNKTLTRSSSLNPRNFTTIRKEVDKASEFARLHMILSLLNDTNIAGIYYSFLFAKGEFQAINGTLFLLEEQTFQHLSQECRLEAARRIYKKYLGFNSEFTSKNITSHPLIFLADINQQIQIEKIQKDLAITNVMIDSSLFSHLKSHVEKYVISIIRKYEPTLWVGNQKVHAPPVKLPYSLRFENPWNLKSSHNVRNDDKSLQLEIFWRLQELNERESKPPKSSMVIKILFEETIDRFDYFLNFPVSPVSEDAWREFKNKKIEQIIFHALNKNSYIRVIYERIHHAYLGLANFHRNNKLTTPASLSLDGCLSQFLTPRGQELELSIKNVVRFIKSLQSDKHGKSFQNKIFGSQIDHLLKKITKEKVEKELRLQFEKTLEFENEIRKICCEWEMGSLENDRLQKLTWKGLFDETLFINNCINFDRIQIHHTAIYGKEISEKISWLDHDSSLLRILSPIIQAFESYWYNEMKPLDIDNVAQEFLAAFVSEETQDPVVNLKYKNELRTKYPWLDLFFMCSFNYYSIFSIKLHEWRKPLFLPPFKTSAKKDVPGSFTIQFNPESASFIQSKPYEVFLRKGSRDILFAEFTNVCTTEVKLNGTQVIHDKGKMRNTNLKRISYDTKDEKYYTQLTEILLGS